jgi:hypothetical protein
VCTVAMGVAVADTGVTIWAIYNNPSDYPGKWVVRGYGVGTNGSAHRHEDCIVADSLPQARAALPPGLYNLGRAAFDDPAIHESWI